LVGRDGVVRGGRDAIQRPRDRRIEQKAGEW
jgi:hypothetical protein